METISEFLKWLNARHIGDASGIVGVLISIVGFIVTIIAVRKSRKAAEEARNAVRLGETVSVISEAVAILEQISHHIRAEKWEIAQDRCITLRKTLIGIKAENPHLSAIHSKKLQSAIQHLTNIDKEIFASDPTGSGILKNTMGTVFPGLINSLHAVLSEIKHQKPMPVK